MYVCVSIYVCMCVYLSMCTYVYVCVPICVYIFVCVPMYLYICVRMCVYSYMYTYVWIYLYVCVCACVHMCVCVYLCVHMCAYVSMYKGIQKNGRWGSNSETLFLMNGIIHKIATIEYEWAHLWMKALSHLLCRNMQKSYSGERTLLTSAASAYFGGVCWRLLFTNTLQFLISLYLGIHAIDIVST